MKKYRKLIIAVIIALIFIGTFVFLWQKSQPRRLSTTSSLQRRRASRRQLLSQVRLNLEMRLT